MEHCVIDTPAGRLLIWELKGYITEAVWANSPLREPSTPLLRKAATEVDEYFKGERKEFDLPLAAPGDPLAQKVWQAILTVPYGKVKTAADVADKIKMRKYLRAVIKLCNTNPIALFIPCHRIVGEKGDGSYVGGMHTKYALWNVEGIQN